MKEQQEIDNQKNQKLLEICGMEMYRTIQRKQLEADERREAENNT